MLQNNKHTNQNILHKIVSTIQCNPPSLAASFNLSRSYAEFISSNPTLRTERSHQLSGPPTTCYPSSTNTTPTCIIMNNIPREFSPTSLFNMPLIHFPKSQISNQLRSSYYIAYTIHFSHHINNLS